MMEDLYGQLLEDLKQKRSNSPVFLHHIDYINQTHYKRTVPYESEDPNDIVTDYIASMTDDYFVDIYRRLFPSSDLQVVYKGYFD